MRKMTLMKVIELRKQAEGLKWMEANPVCPRCKTENGVIGSHYDCMDIILDYCDELWHSAHHTGCGSYGGITRDEALLRIGRRLP